MSTQKEFQRLVYQCLLNEKQYLQTILTIKDLLSENNKDEGYVKILVDSVKKVIKDSKIESK